MATDDQQKNEDQQEIQIETDEQIVYIEDVINPLGIFLYTWMLRLSYILIIGFIFGLFTDGLPPKWSYVYILPFLYDLHAKIRIGRCLLWESTGLFSFEIPDAILYLHNNNWLVLLLFVLIIALICDIGIYHS